ncbi:alpha/beta hydrolase [Novosphingobium flavum]|uniref:Alpha/beta hydrolase n=1 Tax=Novosphingobium flavum TaxID=1778672 RepID=A0A7X1KM25_9SPHN|nr:alpha/beta hydrolase [Novosphingobium flavum]MBC2665850.1 alpha/beta hydrolase [Novosphingobium flavum]
MKFAGSAILAATAATMALSAPAHAEAYKTTFVWLAPGQPGVFYEPVSPGEKARIAVFAMHPDGDYLRPGPTNTCERLAERGYRALCSNATSSKAGSVGDMNQDKVSLNVKAGVTWLRAQAQVQKIVLFGHSGGGAMMSSYQNIAENGLKACQGPEKQIKCSSALADMPPADGVMLIDASMGMPGSNLISIDPAVIDDEDGRKIDPALDMYNPANGFNPKGSKYSPEFTAKFFAGQRDRMLRLVAKAKAQIADIEAGKGHFTDDQPFVVAGAIPRENKLNAQDVRLLSHTKEAWPLLHSGGRITTEVVHTVRVPRSTASPTPLAANALVTTARNFLRTFSITPLQNYGYDETGFYGIDFASSYGTTYNAVTGITKPLLQMGFTGSYEYSFAEGARARAISKDKTLVYLEGAVHGFVPCKECAVAQGLPENAYGDTVKTLYDYIDTWLAKPGRF